MKSVISNGIVIATGDFTETESSFVSDATIVQKSLLSNGYLVNDFPPSESETGWAYFEGSFIELQNEVQEKPPVEVPQSITRAQAKLALLQVGLLDDVQPAIDAIPDPIQRKAAQIEWDDRLTFERANPTLQALAAMLGMSDSQLDELFIIGSTL